MDTMDVIAKPLHEIPVAPTAINFKVKEPPCCPAKMVLFTCNLLVGLLVSQLMPQWLDASGFGAWKTTVKVCTMFCLSYIMIHVGYDHLTSTSQGSVLMPKIMPSA